MSKHRLLALVTASVVILLALGVETAAATDTLPGTGGRTDRSERAGGHSRVGSSAGQSNERERLGSHLQPG